MATIAELEATIEQYKKELAEAKVAPAAPVGPFKLDLGCGSKKQPGFVGVDSISFPGVDHVFDMSREKWPFPDSSVDEAYSAQAVEHIANEETDWELVSVSPAVSGFGGSAHIPGVQLVKKVRYPRAHFFNELWRVLKPGATARIITPWCWSSRALGDPTHKWAPVCEWTWPYLNRKWRDEQAPHDNAIFSCNFDAGYGYSIAQHLQGRNHEFVTESLRDHKEAATDMIATLTAVK